MENQFHNALFPVVANSVLGTQILNLAEVVGEGEPTMREEYGDKDENGVYISTTWNKAIAERRLLARPISATHSVITLRWTTARIQEFYTRWQTTPANFGIASLQRARLLVRAYENSL